MPSEISLGCDRDGISLRMSSRRTSPDNLILYCPDTCAHSIDALSDRIQNHAKLLVPKSTKTVIFLDSLPFDDDDKDYGYKSMLISKDSSGKRKVLLDGEYVFSGCKNEAKRKALDVLLKKSSKKVKETMEKQKLVIPSGTWLFVRD